jgi:chemotaxis signal transduction protein
MDGGGQPPDPHSPLASIRAGTRAALERLRRQTAEEPPQPVPEGQEYLLFTCGGHSCAVALRDLREVLATVPRTVPLPFSPAWMLGIFPLRAELVGLVDPAPVLFGGTRPPDPDPPGFSAVLVAGEGEASLGLAVAAVGDVAVAPPVLLGRDGSRGSVPSSIYAAGVLFPPAGEAYLAIDLPGLVAALLRGLREEVSHG